MGLALACCLSSWGSGCAPVGQIVTHKDEAYFDARLYHAFVIYGMETMAPVGVREFAEMLGDVLDQHQVTYRMMEYRPDEDDGATRLERYQQAEDIRDAMRSFDPETILIFNEHLGTPRTYPSLQAAAFVAETGEPLWSAALVRTTSQATPRALTGAHRMVLRAVTAMVKDGLLPAEALDTVDRVSQARKQARRDARKAAKRQGESGGGK